MKKILFYTNGIGLGGVERVLLTLLEGLDKKNMILRLLFNMRMKIFLKIKYQKK